MAHLAVFPFIGDSIFKSMLETPPLSVVDPSDLVAKVLIKDLETEIKMNVSAYGVCLSVDKIGEKEFGYSILSNANEVITTNFNGTLEFEVRNRKVFDHVLSCMRPGSVSQITMTPWRKEDLWKRMFFPMVKITHGQLVPVQGTGEYRHIIEGRVFPDKDDRPFYIEAKR